MTWHISKLNKYEFFEDNGNYQKKHKAFVVKSQDGKFYGVIKEIRYGSDYSEKRLTKKSTFKEAWKELKKYLKIK